MGGTSGQVSLLGEAHPLKRTGDEFEIKRLLCVTDKLGSLAKFTHKNIVPSSNLLGKCFNIYSAF